MWEDQAGGLWCLGILASSLTFRDCIRETREPEISQLFAHIEVRMDAWNESRRVMLDVVSSLWLYGPGQLGFASDALSRSE